MESRARKLLDTRTRRVVDLLGDYPVLPTPIATNAAAAAAGAAAANLPRGHLVVVVGQGGFGRRKKQDGRYTWTISNAVSGEGARQGVLRRRLPNVIWACLPLPPPLGSMLLLLLVIDDFGSYSCSAGRRKDGSDEGLWVRWLATRF